MINSPYAPVMPMYGGKQVTIPTGAGNTVISAQPGRLCKVLITAASTGAAVLFYDNATTNSGTVIGYVPASAAIGTVYDFNMPAFSGITVVNVTNGPVMTVSFD